MFVKNLFLAVSLILASIVCATEDRIYILSEDLIIARNGIFLMKNQGPIPLGSISYDYETNRFFLEQNYRLIICPSCGKRTYDVIGGICFNPECKRIPD